MIRPSRYFYPFAFFLAAFLLVTPSSRSGLSTNGLSTNGLSTNGLSTNGLSTNGLSTNGSSAPELGKYIERCASGLALAPSWSKHTPTVLERQIVSACLAAHLNARGEHVEISLRGTDVSGDAIGTTPGERAAYTKLEGLYYGDLWHGGLRVATVGVPLRACKGISCGGISVRGRVADLCTKHGDAWTCEGLPALAVYLR